MMGIRMVFLGILFVASATTTAAQTRLFDGEITSGSIAIDVSGVSDNVDFDISGAGFRLIGSAGDFFRVDPGIMCVAPGTCVPGATVPLYAVLVAEFFGDGIAVVNGETLSPAFYSGGFTLPGGNVTIPRGNRKFLKLSAPFTITPTDALQLRVFSDSAARGTADAPWAQGVLTGSGIATVFLERVRIERQTFYVAKRIIYNFNVQ
jgi:hypothetical protein